MFNGEKYTARYYSGYHYEGYGDPERKYIELRSAELAADQKLIREYCYANNS